MYDKIKNILIGITVFIFLLLFAFHYALNSEKIVKALIIRLVSSKQEDIKIKSLSLRRSTFIYPLNLSLENVKCEFDFKGQEGSLSFDNANFFIKDIFRKEFKHVVLTFDDLNLSIKGVEISNLNIFVNSFIDKEKNITFSAETDIGSAQFDSYNISSIKFNSEGDGKVLTIKDFMADFYGGEITAEGVINLDHNSEYELTMKLERINLYELEGVNPSVFSYIRAKVDGDLELNGNKSTIKTLDLNLEALDGAMMKAALMKQLLSMVSASLGKDISLLMKTDDNITVQKALEDLITVDGSVPLSQVKVKLTSESSEKISTLISFESDKFNLNIDSLTIDTNVEGGYQSLLRFFK